MPEKSKVDAQSQSDSLHEEMTNFGAPIQNFVNEWDITRKKKFQSFQSIEYRIRYFVG